MTARRIVLVDDEEALTRSLSSRLARAYPRHRIESANDGAAALTLLEGAVDLLITDVHMPGLSGIDLVFAARSVHPELPVIVMTAFKSVDITSLRSGPFTGFLEKPFKLDLLLQQIDEALSPPSSGFSGAVLVQTLPDIVQLYVHSSATGQLTVRHKTLEGHVFFSQGVVLHAQTPHAVGDEAFYEIMTWSAGEFSMRTGATTSGRSVRSAWQALLLESARRADERLNAGNTHFDSATPNFNNASAAARDLSMNIKESLHKLNQVDGFVGAAIVDSESGMLLGHEGGGNLNLEIAAAGNTEVVRAKRKTMSNLALKDGIEDILITLGKQYHLIRPLRSRPTLFFYVALDRQRANLAMARIALADVEKELHV
ncbi:MAG: response regulator [Labilithrix sp.]|nr:response regulator [Labilithrix sp.]MCW5813014.1 response regulator [Labilithrix sp.]